MRLYKSHFLKFIDGESLPPVIKALIVITLIVDLFSSEFVAYVIYTPPIFVSALIIVFFVFCDPLYNIFLVN